MEDTEDTIFAEFQKRLVKGDVALASFLNSLIYQGAYDLIELMTACRPENPEIQKINHDNVRTALLSMRTNFRFVAVACFNDLPEASKAELKSLIEERTRDMDDSVSRAAKAALLVYRSR